MKNKKLIIIGAVAVVIIAAITGVVLNISGKEKKSNDVVVQTEKEVETESEDESKETDTSTLRNPLTGEKTSKDYSDVRPVAVMLNTIKAALPQSGNSKADVLIEMAEEGGITRVMGIYQDLTDVGNIGTVRSTREYYLSFTRAFDAILVHAGGDSWVLDEIKNTGETTINSMTNGGNAFWRDEARLQYLGAEHTMYTSSENLTGKIQEVGIPVNHTKKDYTVFNFKDKIDAASMKDDANSLKVTFSGYKSTTFNYNKETKKYDVYFWDNEPYMDEAASKQVDVTNIIVLPVRNWSDVDDWGVERQKYDLSGGTGYYVSGGKYREIKWTKGDIILRENMGILLFLLTQTEKNLNLPQEKVIYVW